MEAGKLRTQAILQARTTAKDGEGNAVETWHDLMNLWLEQLEQTGREFYRLSTVNSEITQVFRCRYHPAIDAHKRLKIGGRYFGIIGAEDEGGRHESLLLSCKAVV